MSRVGEHLQWRLRRLCESDWFVDAIRDAMMRRPYVCGGPKDRLVLGEGVVLNDALVNVASGRVIFGDHSFCGHGVSLLTGIHDWSVRGAARQDAVPEGGRDIVIGRGAWIASNAVVLGPVTIGEDAVVCAGAVVTRDVPDGAVAKGNPARVEQRAEGAVNV